jgi:hypothetical protein
MYKKRRVDAINPGDKKWLEQLLTAGARSQTTLSQRYLIGTSV